MQNTTSKRVLFWGTIALIFIALRVFMREVLHVPYDFMPLAALALFAPLMVGRNIKAFALIFAAVLGSDMLLMLFSSSQTTPFYPGFYWQYIAYGLIVLMGFLFSKHTSALSTVLYSFTGAIVFFIISNFGTWVTGLLYPMTPHGLITCYLMGLPFFKASVLGNVFYGMVFYAISCRNTVFSAKFA